MTVSTTGLRQQLQALLLLTNTEIQIAQTRTAQARTEAVRDELTQNAANAALRAVAIDEALRDLGALPEIVRPLIGRGLAVGKALVEQAQPFDEALLGDLALEHQLLDRSRYVKALATASDHADVAALADRLIDAHTATVEWLSVVIAEEALGGPVALRRSPTQWAVGVAARAAGAPGVVAARGLDRLLHTAGRVPSLLFRAGNEVQAAAGAAVHAAASESVEAISTTVGAVRENATAAVGSATDLVRTASGDIDPADLPVDDYDELTVPQVVDVIEGLESSDEVRLVTAYEEAHKNRQGVVSAAQVRLADIAKDVIGIS